MKIDINKIRPNQTDQTVYFTLTDDAGNSYKWHGDIPTGVNPQKYFDARAEEILLLIRRREFPDAPKMQPGIEETELEVFEKWIDAGAIIPAVLDEEGKEIEPARPAQKKPWTQTHPEIKNKVIDVIEIDAVDIIALEEATTVAQLKKALEKIILGN